jgi:hypothetical protein
MNWRRLFHRDKADAEQSEELEFYLDVTAHEYINRGMEPAEARAAARRKLGNTTLIREEVYQMNTVTLVDVMFREARRTLRMIRKSPGFALTVLLSHALGIGANTAMFSVVHSSWGLQQLHDSGTDLQERRSFTRHVCRLPGRMPCL